MSSYYQVFARFAFSNGKPQLSEVSLHTATSYCPFLDGSRTSLMSHTRYFRTQKQAVNYINYLYSRYPSFAAPTPVLDALQLLLF